MDKTFFQGIKQWEIDWQGHSAKMPVFYYDVTSMTAIHTADSESVRKLLPLKAMHPVEIFPGRCLAAFTAFEYRETDIDPYNEFSIAFLVRYGKRPIPFLTAAQQTARRCFSAYVWQLPVTTEIARAGGVEMYGYPKFIADIHFERSEGFLHCDLAEGGKQILRLSGKQLPTAAGNAMRYMTYSVSDGIPLATNVFVNPLEIGETRDKYAATLEIGTDHPIGRLLKRIGLSAMPFQYQYSPLNQAILFPGRNLMDTLEI
jgi:hypothetical protein